MTSHDFGRLPTKDLLSVAALSADDIHNLFDAAKRLKAGRGEHVDVLRHKGGKLPPGYGITRADVEAALAAQKTSVEPGDIVLVRTGHIPSFYELDDPVERVKFLGAPMPGLVSDVVPSERNVAHRIIEEFMIAANEAVAHHLHEAGEPCVYRNHDAPSADRAQAFAEAAAAHGADCVFAKMAPQSRRAAVGGYERSCVR